MPRHLRASGLLFVLVASLCVVRMTGWCTCLRILDALSVIHNFGLDVLLDVRLILLLPVAVFLRLDVTVGASTISGGNYCY